jgi:hypothetical protein
MRHNNRKSSATQTGNTRKLIPIVVSVDERRKDKEDKYTINENVLIEIGVAFVLYDKRVVLLWDKRLSVPSNIQRLYRCEFEDNELSCGYEVDESDSRPQDY